MVFNRFRIKLALRILFICLNLYLLICCFHLWQVYIAGTLLSALFVAQVAGLLIYIDRFSRSINDLLGAINYNDFTIHFKEPEDRSEIARLYKVLNRVLEAFKLARAEREEKAQFLEFVLNHIGVAVMVFEPDGTVEIFNTAARKLLQQKKPFNIQSLMAVDIELVNKLFELDREGQFVHPVHIGPNELQLAVNAQTIRLAGRELKMVTLQNIAPQLDQRELNTWQKLLKVLTHEIMNSVTPIISLSDTANMLLERGEMTEAELADIRKALTTIQNRGVGLVNFVGSFRNLNNLPLPRKKAFSVNELFDQVGGMQAARMQEKGITFSRSVEPSNLELLADREQVEQVLINLLNNAVEAFDGAVLPDRQVSMLAMLDDESRVCLQVIDNAGGIDPAVFRNMFIPFFTTKKGGSGIGLSLTKQIMNNHEGAVMIDSAPGEITRVTLRF